MKFRHLTSAGASLFAASLLIAGCGGGGSGPSNPRPTAIPGQPTPTPIPGQPTPTPIPGQPTPTPTMGPLSLRGQIGFISTRGGGDGDIYAMDANGGNQRALGALNSDSEERSPSISRDGSTIVWSSNRPNKSVTANYEIYIQRPNGTGGQMLEAYTNDIDVAAPDDTEPVISPDGTKIAWTTTRDGNKNIAVTGITGGAQPVLTLANQGEDSQPTWTSDSQNIAFYSERGISRGIYIMDASGNNQRVLLVSDAASGVRYLQPTYAPSGGRFAVTIETGNGSGSTISLRNADGTQVTDNFNAGSGFSFRSQPSFNRDGNRLIYVGSNSSNGRGQIQTANLDGTSERPLTSAGQNFDARFSN